METLTCITDSRGRKTELAYDLQNREIRRTGRDGSVTGQLYDRNGNLRKQIRPDQYARAGEEGPGWEYTHDTAGRLLTVTGPDGVLQERNEYDAQGRLQSTVNATGAGARFHYDLGGRRTAVETKGNARQYYSYDAQGNLTSLADGAGNRTEYVPDKWGRIVEVRTADKGSEYYGYDYAGNLTAATDPKGNTTRYVYNDANRLAEMTDPMGEKETYAYDAEGRLIQKTDRNGTVTHYTYNMYQDLLERRADREGTGERYEYTPEGLLKAAITEGMRCSYTHDAEGRVVEKKASGRTLLTLSYDRNGNLKEQKDVTGRVTEYRYDLQERVTQVWDNGTRVAEYSYNGDGTRKSLCCGSLITEYSYDADRNLTGQRTMLGKEILAENHYRYDGNGNCLEKRQKEGTTRYTYDERNRLTRAEYPGHREELFYDRAGNRTQRRTASITTGSITEQYYYDRNNRLTALTWQDRPRNLSMTRQATCSGTAMQSISMMPSTGTGKWRQKRPPRTPSAISAQRSFWHQMHRRQGPTVTTYQMKWEASPT